MIPREEENRSNKRSKGVDGPSHNPSIWQDDVEDIARDNYGVTVVFGRDHRQSPQSIELVIGIPGLCFVIKKPTSHSELKVRCV